MILKLTNYSQLSLFLENHDSPNKIVIIDAAHKKGSGSTKNGRDSVSKRRGIKIYGKQAVSAGGIIVRQVGSTFHPGFNVRSGKDHTLFALSSGLVSYERLRGRKCVSVYPEPDDKKAKVPSIPKKNFSRRNRRLVQYISRKKLTTTINQK